MIPDQLSYKHVQSSDCVGSGYYVRVNNETSEKIPVLWSDVTDEDSIYILKTIETDEHNNKYYQYWDFGSGWPHFDELMYTALLPVCNRLEGGRVATITGNIGRIKSLNRLATETFERTVSLYIPRNMQEMDLVGFSGERFVTGDADPVMFSSIDILDELYWVVRTFSDRHRTFQERLDENVDDHQIQSGDALRAYQSLAIAYPYFEGLLVEFIDRVDLREQPYEGDSPLRFRSHKSKMVQGNVKTTLDTLEGSRDVITEYEREFLVDTFYDEGGELGMDRNTLAHSIFEATRGFQTIQWQELARRLLVSIAFLDEKVACSYNNTVATADISVFERWLEERLEAGFDSVLNARTTGDTDGVSEQR